MTGDRLVFGAQKLGENMRQLIPIVLLLNLVACDPLVMIPGGELSGVTQPVPEDWSFTDQIETIQLETRPDDPYSVNIWGVGVEGEFFVASGKADNAWAAHIAADDRVRLRVDETIYEMRAERDDTAEAKERFLAAAKAKYDFEPEPDQASEAILFRLVAR
jgi:hypothetical protein